MNSWGMPLQHQRFPDTSKRSDIWVATVKFPAGEANGVTVPRETIDLWG